MASDLIKRRREKYFFEKLVFEKGLLCARGEESMSAASAGAVVVLAPRDRAGRHWAGIGTPSMWGAFKANRIVTNSNKTVDISFFFH
jgi:hypothetical protein